jgi:hypothetical protein
MTMIDTDAPSPLVRHPNGTEDTEFHPEYASYYTERRDRIISDEFSEDNSRYTVVTTDDADETFEFTYAFSYALVKQATYDVPEEEVTIRTSPVDYEWVMVDGDDPISSDSIRFDGRSLTLPADFQTVWDRAGLVDTSEDFICVSGIDEGEPIGRPFEVYYILIDVRKQGSDEPVFRHDNA